MPAFITSPFQQRTALLPGVPSYSFGSFNDRAPYSRFSISNVALTTNVVTLTVKLLEGLIPIVGALISVQGTQAGGGSANVTNVALASVTIDTTLGTGTLTYAVTHANIASVADSGQALVPQPIIPEAATAVAGQQFAVQATSGVGEQGINISWFYEFPSQPTLASTQLYLQGADVDQDALYTNIDGPATGLTLASETRAVNSPQKWNFLRVKIASITGGTLPTVAAGIVI